MIRTVLMRRVSPATSGVQPVNHAQTYSRVSVPSEPWDAAPYLAQAERDRLSGMRPTIHRQCDIPGCTGRVHSATSLRCAEHRGKRVRQNEIGGRE